MPPIPPPRPNPPPGSKDSPADFQALADQLQELTDTIKESRDAGSSGPSPFLAEFRELTAKLRELTRPPVIAPNQDAFNRLMDAQARWADAMRQRIPPPEPGIPPAMRPTQTQLGPLQELANQSGQPMQWGGQLLLPQRPPAPATRLAPVGRPTQLAPVGRPTQLAPVGRPTQLVPPAPPPPVLPPLPPWQSIYGRAREELRKPDVQAEIRQRALAGVFEHAQDVDLVGRRTLIQNQALDSPEHRALAAAQARLGVIQQSGSAVQAAQLAQARARYAESPEGRQQFRQTQQAQEAIQEAETRRRRAENITQYGELGGALRNAAGTVKGFGVGLAVAGTAISAVTTGVQSYLRVTGDYVAAASPQTAATTAGSLQMLRSTIGQDMVGGARTRAAWMQSTAQFLQRHPELRRTVGSTMVGAQVGGDLSEEFIRWRLPGQIIGGTAGYLQGVSHEAERSIYGGVDWAFGTHLRDRWDRAQAQGTRPEFESFEGLPGGPTFTSGEQVMFSAQQMGLNTSPLEAENLRLQLENVVGLLQTIAANSNDIPNMNPAWR